MPVYRIEPIARPGDPRWQDRPRFKEVVVRALSPGLARTWARDKEFELVTDSTIRIGNESLASEAGVEDPKLYRCIRLGPKDAKRYGEPTGPDAVLYHELAEPSDATPSSAA